MNSNKLTKMKPQPQAPWEVLNLVATHLDPNTLAMASCVNKSLSISMSSDHLWKPICLAFYPSLFNLHAHAHADVSANAEVSVSFHRLYALGRLSDKRRVHTPLETTLSLNDIIFAIGIYSNDSCLSTILKQGCDLDGNGIFRFDIDMDDEKVVKVKGFDNLRITWNIVLKGFKSVFSMMDSNGKGYFVLGSEGWFSRELPAAVECWSCSSSGASSGVVADMRLGLRETNGEIVIEKISVGVLNTVSWRYVCIDDALRYLQYFLL